MRKLFGNRTERRAQAQGRAPRRPPAIEELPEGLRELIAYAANFGTIEQMLRASTVEGFTHQQVHQAVAWLRQMRQGTEAQAAQHPQFATYFPDEAAKLASEQSQRMAPQLVGPNGAPITAQDS